MAITKIDQIDSFLTILDVLPKKAQGKRGHGSEVWSVINVQSQRMHTLKRGAA